MASHAGSNDRPADSTSSATDRIPGRATIAGLDNDPDEVKDFNLQASFSANQQLPETTENRPSTPGGFSGPSALDQFAGQIVSPSGGPKPAAPAAGAENWVDPDLSAVELPRHFGAAPALSGDVFLSKDMPEEPPDFDIFIWLARLFGLTLLMGLPFVIFAHAYQRFGVILIYLLLAAIFILSRFGGGMFWLSILGMTGLLGSIFRSRQRRIPVRTCRIMDDQQQEHIVRIKGRIVRGDIHEYDRVAIWGGRRAGTLIFRRGFNLRAASWIQLEGRFSWILALIFGLMNVWLFVELSRIFPGLTNSILKFFP